MDEIRRDQRVTLMYVSAATVEYVTVIGTAVPDTGAMAKAAHWKDSWASLYEGQRHGCLVRLRDGTGAHRIEVWSGSGSFSQEVTMKRASFVLSVVCLAVASSCAKPPAPQPAPDTKADEAALRAATDTWLKLYNAGDVTAMGASVLDDAIEMRPDGPELVGKSAIVAELGKDFVDNTQAQTATVDEVAAWGDIGMSRGTWQNTSTPKKGAKKAVTAHGKWIVLHKRAADGSWKEWRHMWNQDRSAPPAVK